MNVNKVLNTRVHRYRRWRIDKKKHKKGQQSHWSIAFAKLLLFDMSHAISRIISVTHWLVNTRYQACSESNSKPFKHKLEHTKSWNAVCGAHQDSTVAITGGRLIKVY